MLNVIDVYELLTRTCDPVQVWDAGKALLPYPQQPVSLSRDTDRNRASLQIEGLLQLLSTREVYRTALAVYRGI